MLEGPLRGRKRRAGHEPLRSHSAKTTGPQHSLQTLLSGRGGPVTGSPSKSGAEQPEKVRAPASSRPPTEQGGEVVAAAERSLSDCSLR